MVSYIEHIYIYIYIYVKKKKKKKEKENLGKLHKRRGYGFESRWIRSEFFRVYLQLLKLQ